MHTTIINPRLRQISLSRNVDSSISNVLEEICTLIKLNVKNSEKIGLKIRFNQLYPIHIEYRYKNNVSAKLIIDRMSYMLQSNATVNINHIYVEAKILSLHK